MNNFKIAAAQVASKDGNISANIQRHRQVMAVAAKQGVSIIIFPELSLTGYIPEQASRFTLDTNDKRLHTLLEDAGRHGLTVVAGAPVNINGRSLLGALIISPSGTIDTYAKMHLHSGEKAFFSAGKAHRVITLDGYKIGIAVCADTNEPSHAGACAKMGASIYAAGVLITSAGYAMDAEMLKQHAAAHDMLVVMANHNRPTGAWSPIGKSAIWSPEGCIGKAGETHSALVMAEKTTDQWRAQLIELT